LVECFLEEGLIARDAYMPFLNLFGSRLEHPTDTPLDADRLTATAGLSLASATIIGHAEAGTVRLIGAHIRRPTLPVHMLWLVPRPGRHREPAQPQRARLLTRASRLP
jgi:hypothetical protein